MKTKLLIAFLLILFTASLHQASGQPITLTGTSYTNAFDNLQANAGPDLEWFTYTGASASAPGSISSWSAVNYQAYGNWWTNTSGRFANQASTVDYSTGNYWVGTESRATQSNAVNRCMAVRQVTATDSGVAFVIKIADTLNRKNFHLYADLLNLDFYSPRTSTWTVDYGVGASPTAFSPLATWVNTPGNFTTYHMSIDLPNGTVDNQNGPVWIRFAVLQPTSGSGNRETTGLDNFGLTWEPGTACVGVNITGNPAPVNGSVNGNASFTVTATGTLPRNYVWVKNGSTVMTDDGFHISGSTAPTLSFTTLVPGDAGTYSCIVSNVCAGVISSQTSLGAELKVSVPPATNIAYLHTLVDQSSWAPTNTSQFWQVTGTITTATNATTGNTASYYIQDGTGGINLFATYGGTWRPLMGDVVTAIGYLQSYQGNLELYVNMNDPATTVSVLSNNIANYPVAKVLSWDHLAEFGTNADLNFNYAGSICILTDIHFGTNINYHTGNTNRYFNVTNSSGQIATVYFPSTVINDLTNRTIPEYAYAAQGPLVTYAPSFYEIYLTSWQDLLLDPLQITITHSGTSSTITWTAIPTTWTYSVLRADAVGGPYTALATGLKFSTTSGTYTDNSAGGTQKFYKVTSP